jgi:glycine oxidase
MNILIAGAGIVGCAIACELASRGARVTIVDARGIGSGATHASAGILAPHIEGHLAPLRTLGVRSLELYDRFVDRVAAESGQPVDYQRTGTLEVAITSDEAAALCAASRALAGLGVAHSMLDGSEARALEPELPAAVVSALLVPDHGYVAADTLTRALVAAATKHGASFAIAPAVAVRGGSPPEVATPDGTMTADAVVVAAGSWSGSLTAASPDAGGARTAIRPIRGQLLRLRLATPPASRVIWGSGCYLVPRRDGAVLAGATVEDVGFDETATASGVQRLLAASTALLPILQQAAFEEVRVGLRPMTPDELPAIGPSSTERNVFYASGHYRNGVLLAPLTAALVADLLLDGRERPELALVRPDRLGL